MSRLRTCMGWDKRSRRSSSGVISGALLNMVRASYVARCKRYRFEVLKFDRRPKAVDGRRPDVGLMTKNAWRIGEVGARKPPEDEKRAAASAGRAPGRAPATSRSLRLRSAIASACRIATVPWFVNRTCSSHTA